jgi:hypothetical protein
MAQSNAWVDRKIYRRWIMEVFHPHVVKEFGENTPILLLVDNAPGHDRK